MSPYIALLGWLCCFVGHSEGDYKRWTQNTNFENGDNWAGGNLPCSQDIARFPQDAPPVYVQTNMTISELVLPVNGELILGDYVSFAFPVPDSPHDPDCPGTDISYTGVEAKSWYNPAYWCTTADPEGECSATQPDLLHSERLPCRNGGATFPEDSTFLVDLDTGIDIYVNSLHMDGKSYSTGDFRRFLDSPEGQAQFKRTDGTHPTTINVLGEDCQDETGCACGNDKGPILDEVCAQQGEQCAEDPGCDNSFLPQGACCHMCGAMMELEYDHNSFRITTFTNMIHNKYLSDMPTVRSYVSKTSMGQIQVVLTDNDGGKLAVDVAKQLDQDLLDDISGEKKYGISSIEELVVSGSEPITPAPQTGGMSSSSVAGLIIGLIILMAIIGLASFCFADRRSTNPRLSQLKMPDVSLPSIDVASIKNKMRRSMRRMTNSKNDDLELGPTVGFKDLMKAGFDNPMYDNIIKGDGGAAASAVDPRSQVLDDSGFANPLYGQGAIEEVGQANGRGASGGSSSVMCFNPAFSAEGIEDDSVI